MTQIPNDYLLEKLEHLKLTFIKKHCETFAIEAAKTGKTHLDYLAQLIEGEASLKHDAKIARCIKLARFPVIKSLDTFQW